MKILCSKIKNVFKIISKLVESIATPMVTSFAISNNNSNTPPLIGDILTVNSTWTGSPSLTYQWYNQSGLISGAISASYTVLSGDNGSALRVKVTATNAGGFIIVTSNSQAIIGSERTDTITDPTNGFPFIFSILNPFSYLDTTQESNIILHIDSGTSDGWVVDAYQTLISGGSSQMQVQFWNNELSSFGTGSVDAHLSVIDYLVFFFGNSNTASDGPQITGPQDLWVNQVFSAFGTTGSLSLDSWWYNNNGVNGNTIDGIATGSALKVTIPGTTATIEGFTSTSGSKIVFVNETLNAINDESLDEAQLEQAWRDCVTAVNAITGQPCKLVVSTGFGPLQVGGQGAMNANNLWLRNNWQSMGASGFVDFDVQMIILNCNDSTYWDGLHFKPTVAPYLAELVIKELNRVVGLTYTPYCTASPATNTINPVHGSAVTVTLNGVWGNGPVVYTYQWYSNYVIISGATGQSYTPVSGDIGNILVVVITATNDSGSTSSVVITNTVS